MKFAYAMNNDITERVMEKEICDTASESRSLLEAEPGRTYIVKSTNTDDDEMNAFLFRLGCYQGEPITLVSKKKKSCVVVIKDGRYSLDQMLSEAIII